MLKEKRSFSFIITMLFVITAVFSQKKVKDVKFNNMLSQLLSHSVPEITPSEIRTSNITVFLDAREKKEYTVSHIKDAVWVGYNDFNLSRVSEVPKDKKIIVYCSIGYRSEKIAEKLLKVGYTDVSNLYGGVFEWVHEEKKIHNNKGETKAVHAFNKEWSQWLFIREKVY